MKQLLTALLTLLCMGSMPPSVIAQESARPNIILVIADDQRADTLWAMPELQAIASRGTTFTNAFSTSALCCPARVSIYTGLYAHESGVLRNSPPRGGWASADMSTTLFTELHDAGYRVGHIGKMLNGTPTGAVAPGVDYDCTFIGNGGYYGAGFVCNGETINTSSSTYSTDFIIQRAQAFIASTPPDVPYFLALGVRAAHNPFTPATRDSGAFASYAYSRANVNEDTSDKCPHLHNLPVKSSSASNTRKQLQTLLSVDRGMASLTAGLDWTRTVFIYTSDQGIFNGEHRLGDKGAPYEETIRVPMVMVIPGSVGGVSNPNLVILQDLHLLIKDMAGIPILSGWQGAAPSLRGALVSGIGGGHEYFYLSQFDQLDSAQKPGYIGVRDGRYKLIEWSYGCREFYDLQADPAELANLYVSPLYAEQIGVMLDLLVPVRERMLAWGWSDEWGWSSLAPLNSPEKGGR